MKCNSFAKKVINPGKFKIHWWVHQRDVYSEMGGSFSVGLRWYLMTFLVLGLVETSDLLIDSKLLFKH